MEKMLRLTLLFKIIPIFIVVMTMAITVQSRNKINFVNCSNDSPHLLIDIAEPKKYDINLKIKLNNTIGTMNITIHVKTVTRKLSLHAHRIRVNYYKTMIKPINGSAVPNKLLSLINCDNIEVINLVFLRFLHPGLYLLYLEFNVYFSLNGITSHNPYIWNDVTKTWLITNLHTSNVTRGLFPCWDQPGIKANFSITVQHPTNFSYMIFSNFLVRKQWKVDNETLSTAFYDISSMPTYLLTFAMVDNIVKISNGINYVWGKQKMLEKMEYALEVAQYVTLEMSEKTNLRPSVIESVNHIMIPNAPMKSMGKPGVIIYREQDVILNESSSTIGRHINIIKLITYESTLQWFNRLIGPYTYSDLWIHKMLSSFYSYYMPSKIWVEDRYMDLFVVQYLQPALNNDDILELEPIINEVNRIHDEIDAFVFYEVYRKKGAALIHMLFHLISPTKFEAGVGQYLNTRTTDLWTSMESFLCDEQCKFFRRLDKGHSVKEIMETWLNTKYYNELHVTRNFENNTAYCKVKFHKNELMTNLENWKIPITYISQSNLTSDNVMNITLYHWEDDIVITNIKPRDFIIINAKHIGYYRVNYDHKSWYKISSFLQYDNFMQIPVLNRAQLINDVYYFTMNNDIHVQHFLNIIKYLKWEKDFIAWHPMFNILSYMSSFFEYAESTLVKTHLLEILNGIIANEDYEFQYYDNDIMPKALRVLAIKWACRLGHIQCRKAATVKLFMHLTKANNTVPPIWEDWVFCTGMMLANKTIWFTMLKEAERYADIKRFQYLTCTENEDFIQYYMDYLNSESLQELKNISKTDILFSILKKHSRKDVLLNYVLENYELIKDRIFPTLHHRDILGVIIMNLNSEEQLNKIHNFAIGYFELYPGKEARFVFSLLAAIDIIFNYRKKQVQEISSKFNMF